MKPNKKLFLVFLIVFSLAFAAGGVFAINANAQCGLSSCVPMSFQSPCALGVPACNCGHYVSKYPIALYWQSHDNASP